MLHHLKTSLLTRGEQTLHDRFGPSRSRAERSKSDDLASYKIRDARVLARSLRNNDRVFEKDGKDVILKRFVEEVEPKFMEGFVEQAPKPVVQAMRQTVTNMLGTLPPNFFTVTISTIGENLAQLMYSVLMTGYMFRNASYRMELRKMLKSPASETPAPDTASQAPSPLPFAEMVEEACTSTPVHVSPEEDKYATGVQKLGIEGEVLRWHKQEGLERSHALQYIEMLENENIQLRARLKSKSQTGMTLRGESNELLDYVKGLEPQSVQALTSCAGQDVINASYSFVDRLMGTSDKEHLKRTSSECNSAELAQLLFWLMVVGYTLRSMEVAYDMEKALGSTLCGLRGNDNHHGLLS